MKNKLTVLLLAVLLSSSLVHTEAYARPNPDFAKSSEISENVKPEFYAKSKELTSAKKFVSKEGAKPYPTEPDEWNN